MKKTLLLLLLILVGFQGFSQTAGISYQAVILNPNTKELPGANAQTNILANSKIFVQFTIIDDFNNQEYQEYHQTTTDIYGMVNLLIGHGIKKGSNNFDDIIWNGFSKKLKVDIDFSGKGNAYTLLSEQELTFMPQPALVEDTEAILNNAADIIAEQNRAILAESFLQASIDENKTSAETAIIINSNALASEVIRATNAETAIDSKLVTEVGNLTVANAALQTNIDVVQSDVDANKIAVNTAIAAVQLDVDANEAASLAADTLLQTNIDMVQADVNANEAAANAADATLQTNINAVQTDVDANETAANTAIAAVQLDVDANEAASLAADTLLQTNIDMVQADVNANEAASSAADATLQTNINAVQTDVDANETAASTAIAAVQTDVDANEATSLAADTVLQMNINAVQADVDANETATNNALALKANIASPTFTGTVSGIDKTMVGLGNVDNTSDANKPVSTAAQTALDLKVDKVSGERLINAAEIIKLSNQSGTNTGDQDLSSYATNSNLALKADIASPTFTGTVSGIDKTMVGLGNVDNTSDANKPVSTATQTALDLKVDKVSGERLINAAEITKLSNQSGTNTGDQDLSSYATNSNLALKADIASPTFTGTVSGIDKTMVGLGNVDNTSDANKPVSTAAQTALDLKVDKVSGERLINAAEITKLSNQSGTNTGDQDLSSYATNTNLALKADIASPTFTGTVSGIDKTMVGLGNVDNTSDANKPVSTATQTTLDLKVDKVTGERLINAAEITKLSNQSGTNTGDQDLSSYATNTNLALKADIASPTFTGTVSGIDKTMVGLGNVDNTSDANKPVSTAAQTALDLKVDKVTGERLINAAEITKLSNQSGTNTGDQDLSSYATNTNLALKADIASPTFTGTVSGIDKTMVGLGNVDNTSDANKPVSTAAQTVLDLKAPLASPTLTGTPLAPTATAGTSTTQIATTAFVIDAITTASTPDASTTVKGKIQLAGDLSGTAALPSIANDAVTSAKIADGTIVNTDINSSAAIAFSKLNISKADIEGLGIPGEDTDTTYSAGTGLTLTGTTLSIDSNVVTSNYSGVITTTGFIKSGGTASQFLKADGSVDATSYAPLASPTFTGTVSGISATMVGLGNVDNTSDADKPVSTATQTSLDLKAPLASPTLTGTPLAPTATAGTSTTQIATTEFVTTATTGKFVDLTTNQTIAGIKTFSSDITVNGVKIGRGDGNNGENTAVGNGALGTGTGSRNSAFGNGALRSYSGTGFDNNTSVGYSNLPGLTTGSGNTSVGAESMMGLSIGTSNTSIGNQSLINTSGNNNVGVGKSSGSTITTGSNNTIIGTEANVATNNQTNSTAIGFQAVAAANNTIQLGNTNVTLVNTSGAITSGGGITGTSIVKVGGTSSEYLMADGSVSTGASPVREVADEFTATASQSGFTLTQTPSVNSKVKMYVNGIRISNTAYSTSGTTLTYIPANNGGYNLSLNDRIQFDYYY